GGSIPICKGLAQTSAAPNRRRGRTLNLRPRSQVARIPGPLSTNDSAARTIRSEPICNVRQVCAMSTHSESLSYARVDASARMRRRLRLLKAVLVAAGCASLILGVSLLYVEVFLGGGTPMGIRLSISPSVLISEGRIWIARKTIITASEVTGMVDVDFGYNIS